VYNGVHLYLAESGGSAGIDDWLAALDVAEALRLRRGSRPQEPGAFDGPSQIQATRQYLTDARHLLVSSERAQEFYEGMLALAPESANPGRCGRRDHVISRTLTLNTAAVIALMIDRTGGRCSPRPVARSVAHG